jgi:hypothetical protein
VVAAADRDARPILLPFRQEEEEEEGRQRPCCYERVEEEAAPSSAHRAAADPEVRAAPAAEVVAEARLRSTLLRVTAPLTSRCSRIRVAADTASSNR